MTSAPAGSLVRASHPGPALAVTTLTAALATASDLAPGRTVLVTLAVAAGQLSIGWSNDLLDRERDSAVGRTDKPLVSGRLDPSVVRGACGAALVGTGVLSVACGVVPGLVHLGCVASGWSYNLGLKATVWSWLPYAITFGGLPVFVVLAAPGAAPPPPWMVAAGALLGVGAHLVNVLPDLADDAATGVRGLPHRVGPRWTPPLAVAILTVASLVIAREAEALPVTVMVVALAAVAGLAVLTLVAGGRTPFRAAMGIALVDAVMLVVAE